VRLTLEPPLVTAVAVREIARSPGWIDLVETLRSTPGFWLLESALPSPGLGRFDFAGAHPYLTVQAFGRRTELRPLRATREDLPHRPCVSFGDPLETLRGLCPPAPAELPAEAPPFVGGAVGWCGYELSAQLEAVAFRGLDDLGAPDLCWAFVDRVLAFDRETDQLVACALGFGRDRRRARNAAERAADALAERVTRGHPDPFVPCETPTAASSRGSLAQRRPSPPVQLRDPETGLALHAFFDASAYVKTVAQVKERIAAGDVYQANLTHRLDVRFQGDPWRLYTMLRRCNPAPFAAFLSSSGLAVVGSSPESFLRLRPDRWVESRPMKGTRPRGRTPEGDRALERELAVSSKDRAENLMIVDLMRNDLGRVCEVGSVHVPELMSVEAYATVFQMVSRVAGRLRRDADAFDLLRAAFPPGSMTGAPKIAAMKLLARLEPVRRGVYSGTLGYLDVRGSADLSVVIRTVLVRDGIASLHVGGGIVADSDPVGEWRESLDKARALLDAIALARRGGG
jgi:aminodeoxychorismate synthase component I